MTVSEKHEHFVYKSLLCGMCFHVTQKYFLHQLDSKSPDSLVDKQTHQPTLELF